MSLMNVTFLYMIKEFEYVYRKEIIEFGDCVQVVQVAQNYLKKVIYIFFLLNVLFLGNFKVILIK